MPASIVAISPSAPCPTGCARWAISGRRCATPAAPISPPSSAPLPQLAALGPGPARRVRGGGRRSGDVGMRLDASAPRMKASTDAFSIADGYEDALGVWRPLAPRTRAALRAAMSAEGDAPPPARVIVARTGERRDIAGPGRIVLEDGRTLDVERSLPPDLPPGYHSLALRADVEPTRLIVAPQRCALPARRGWGWAAQLYATRSSASWGIGDLADLRRLGAWATGLGASLLLINPRSAPAPLPTQRTSPYCASSGRFLNPLYLRIEESPGAAALGADLERLAAAGRALNGERRIDRARVFALKREAREQLWRHDGGRGQAFEDLDR